MIFVIFYLLFSSFAQAANLSQCFSFQESRRYECNVNPTLSFEIEMRAQAQKDSIDYSFQYRSFRNGSEFYSISNQQEASLLRDSFFPPKEKIILNDLFRSMIVTSSEDFLCLQDAQGWHVFTPVSDLSGRYARRILWNEGSQSLFFEITEIPQENVLYRVQCSFIKPAPPRDLAELASIAVKRASEAAAQTPLPKKNQSKSVLRDFLKPETNFVNWDQAAHAPVFIQGKCLKCGVTESPVWRKNKTRCNKCGLQEDRAGEKRPPSKKAAAKKKRTEKVELPNLFVERLPFVSSLTDVPEER